MGWESESSFTGSSARGLKAVIKVPARAGLPAEASYPRLSIHSCWWEWFPWSCRAPGELLLHQLKNLLILAPLASSGEAKDFQNHQILVLFCSMFFPQFISFLSRFTINNMKKPGDALNTLFGNSLSYVTNIITYKSCSPWTISLNSLAHMGRILLALISWTPVTFLSEFSPEDSPLASLFPLAVCSWWFGLSLPCYSKVS